MNMWNVHRMFITHILDNIGILKQKNTYDFLLQVRNLITFELKGFFDMRERHNLSMLTFPSAPNHMLHPPQGLSKLRKSTVFFGRWNSTHWLFFKSPKSSTHASGAWYNSPPAVTFSIWGFYCDISEWHVRSTRSWTPALMFAPN